MGRSRRSEGECTSRDGRRPKSRRSDQVSSLNADAVNPLAYMDLRTRHRPHRGGTRVLRGLALQPLVIKAGAEVKTLLKAALNDRQLSIGH